MREDISLRANQPSPEVQELLEKRQRGINPDISELRPEGFAGFFGSSGQTRSLHML